MTSKKLQMLAVGWLLLGSPTAALAQCWGGSTRWYAVGHVRRTAGNNVEMLAGSWVVGDSYQYWNAYVSATAYSPSNSVLDTDERSSDYGSSDDPTVSGTYAHLKWNYAPSSTGAGTYSLTGYAEQDPDPELCPWDNYYSGPIQLQLQVNKPTIAGMNTALWNLGPNSSDPWVSAKWPYGNVYQSAVISINTNCNAGDTCNETPQWHADHNGGTQQAYLTNYSGSQTTLVHSDVAGNCSYDTEISVGIGGFFSDPVAVLVNSPASLIHQAGQDYTEQSGGTGYITHWFYSMTDACPYGYPVSSIPVQEVLGQWNKPPTWFGPSPGGENDFDISQWVFTDGIGEWDATNPVPVFTSRNAPFTYNTLVAWASQTWYAGSTQPGASSGIPVSGGTVQLYRHHGQGSVQ
jgi:hypothetical protein